MLALIAFTAFSLPGCGAAPDLALADLSLGPGVDAYRPASALDAYYVDANLGSDGADGRTPATAWKSLDRAHDIVFRPGTVLRLARGSVWKNQQLLLDRQAWGTEERPIVVEAYGSGEAPTIRDPRALWDKSLPFAAVAFSQGARHVRVLDIRIQEGGAQMAVAMNESTSDLVVAGLEISGFGTGVSVMGEGQKILSCYIHDIGSSGQGSGIGIGIVGKDLEIAWNRLEDCRLVRSGEDDGGALEFYNYCGESGYDYLSESISIHHNRIEDCLDFMECYGNVVGMTISYNVYANSPNEALEFHFDDCEHPVWTHVCTYGVLIEHNTFVPSDDAPQEGWGLIGLLVDWVPAHDPDPARSRIEFRDNVFVTNYRVIAFKNVLGSSLVHSRNLYSFLGSGRLTNDEEGLRLDPAEIVADPLFADAASGDYRPEPGSPAIDSGGPGLFPYDIRMRPVPAGRGADIGAFEL
jgi:hypothetical protein